MITTIVRNATREQRTTSRKFVADLLHIPYEDVSTVVAVAYICKHFEQGSYSGWDGWIEMREADQKSIDQYTERKRHTS